MTKGEKIKRFNELLSYYSMADLLVNELWRQGIFKIKTAEQQSVITAQIANLLRRAKDIESANLTDDIATLGIIDAYFAELKLIGNEWSNADLVDLFLAEKQRIEKA